MSLEYIGEFVAPRPGEPVMEYMDRGFTSPPLTPVQKVTINALARVEEVRKVSQLAAQSKGDNTRIGELLIPDSLQVARSRFADLPQSEEDFRSAMRNMMVGEPSALDSFHEGVKGIRLQPEVVSSTVSALIDAKLQLLTRQDSQREEIQEEVKEEERRTTRIRLRRLAAWALGKEASEKLNRMIDERAKDFTEELPTLPGAVASEIDRLALRRGIGEGSAVINLSELIPPMLAVLSQEGIYPEIIIAAIDLAILNYYDPENSPLKSE